MDLLSSIVIGLFVNCLSEGIKGFSGWIKNKKEYERLNKIIETAISEIITKYEYTVLDSDKFGSYLHYYNLVENIFNYITSRSVSYRKDDFINKLFDNAYEYLKEGKKLVEDDKLAVREFIEKIYDIMWAYFTHDIPNDLIAVYFNTNQILATVNQIDDKQNKILNYLENQKSSSNELATSQELTPRQRTAPTYEPYMRIKKVYCSVPNYINRAVVHLKDISDCSWFPNKYSKKPLDVCLESKRVVLLGEAGSGKSVLLKQLAHEACDTEYYPLFCQLNQYDYSKSIEDLICDTYPSMVDYSKVFLILDGYDEIGSGKRDEFARRLLSFSSKNAKTIIIISTRSNFYIAGGDNGEESTFESFQPYEIVPLSKENIDTFLCNRGIDCEEFWSEVSNKKLESLVFNPFYLHAITTVFQEEHTLPDTGALKVFIETRLTESMRKYSRTQKIDIGSIYSALKDIAVSLQLAHLTDIDKSIAKTIIEDTNVFDMLLYSGIISESETGKLSFEHNNLREYLAAEYLSKLSIEELAPIICSEDYKVLPSYVNTLSYLIQMDSNGIYDYLFQHDPEILIRFEKNRLTAKQRSKIVKDYLDNLAEKRMWLSFGREHPNRLAVFGQSKDLCTYLLDQICKPVSIRSQHNAIYVLSHFTNLFGLEDDTRIVLFYAIKSDRTSNSVCDLMFETLAKLHLDNDEITDYAASIYRQTQSGSLCKGILNYLLISGRFRNHLNLFFYEAKKQRKDDDGYSFFYETLIRLCDSIDDIDSLCKVLRFLSSKHRSMRLYSSIYETIMKCALNLYPEHKTKIFNAVYKVMCNEWADTELIKQCVSFFDATKTRKRAFIKLYQSSGFIAHASYLLSIIGNEQCYTHLMNSVVKQPELIKANKEYIINVTMYLLRHNKPLGELYRTKLTTSGIKIPDVKVPIDYTQAQHKGKQLFLSWLFDYQLLIESLNDFASVFEKANITIKEASDRLCELLNDYNLDYDNYVKRQALLNLWWNVLQNISDNHTVFNCISKDAWMQHHFSLIRSFLSINDSLELTDKQACNLKHYCLSLLDSVDIKNGIKDTGKGFSYTNNLANFVFFSDLLDIEYDKRVYKDMMRVPCILFAHNDSNQFSIPAYIQKHLSDKEIREQIKSNFGKVCSITVDMYISYCKEKRNDAAIDYAKDYCLHANKTEAFFSNAVNYLYEIKGADYLYDILLDNAEGKLLQAIIDATVKEKSPRLRDRLEELSKSDDENCYLAALIELESEYGLNKYYEQIKRRNSSFQVDNGFYAGSPEQALETVCSIDLLSTIDSIKSVCFSPDFKDAPVFSLRSQLYKVYQNMASNNPEQVLCSLRSSAKCSDISDEERGFCNSLIETILPSYHYKKEKKWSLPDVRAFLANHQCF